MICDDRDKCWNLLLGFVCYLHKDGCLLLDLLFHFLAKRIKEVTFTAVFEHNSRIIIVEKKKTKQRKKETILAFTSRSGERCNLTFKTFTLRYILAQHSNRICGNLTFHECNYVGGKLLLILNTSTLLQNTVITFT